MRAFLRPIRSILSAQSNRAKSDYELLLLLRQYPAPLMKYVAARLNMAIEHVRGRISIMAGSIDKVGIIPLVIGWMFSGEKFIHAANVERTYILIATTAFGLFYLRTHLINASAESKTRRAGASRGSSRRDVHI
jgi:hypothetical protein